MKMLLTTSFLLSMFRRLLTALVVFLAIDAVWLSLMVPVFYAPQLGALLTETPNWVAAGIFYVAYGLGVGVLSQWSPLGSWRSFGFGALIGAMTYGTYDMTNLTLIDGWPVLMTVVDIMWGALLTGVTMAATVAWSGRRTV